MRIGRKWSLTFCFLWRWCTLFIKKFFMLFKCCHVKFITVPCGWTKTLWQSTEWKWKTALHTINWLSINGIAYLHCKFFAYKNYRFCLCSKSSLRSSVFLNKFYYRFIWRNLEYLNSCFLKTTESYL